MKRPTISKTELAEIQESEAQLRQVIDTIPTLAWCNRADGPNEFLSKRWHEYTGMGREESHGWGWQAAFHPDDLPPLMKRWGELIVSGEPGEIEARLRRYDGIYRWFLIRVAPFRDHSGRIVRWYGTSTDIEDRKCAEQTLAARETEFSLILNTMPAMAWSARPDGQAEYVNQHYLSYVGLPVEQLLGFGWAAIVHPDDLGGLTKLWQRLLRTDASGETEARLRRHDGQYRWFLFRTDPMRDASGQITKWFGINTDIEDRKQAEDQLRRSQAFLAEGQNLARVGNFSWAVANDDIKWSEQLYRIFEFDPGEPITLEKIGTRVHPEDRPMMFDMVEKAQRAVSDFEYEHRLLMPNHSIKYLHLIAHLVPNIQGRLEYLGAVQDVTHRRVADEALARARSQLASVSRVTSLGVLTASIAHEVNQPLSGIITNASTCVRMLSAKPPNVEGARETALRTIRDGNRASDVIGRLRALFTKKEATSEPVDLNDTVKEVIALAISELQRGKVVLRREFVGSLPNVRGDRVQLQQVIVNLIRNATDAMSAVQDRPRQLIIRTEREGTSVRLVVKDAGIGFDAQSSDRLFEAFYHNEAGRHGN